MVEPCIFGWDIGGAHLKLAAIRGSRVLAVRQVACPLWQGLDELRHAVESALAGLNPADRHALTMTGELADVFPDRASGVATILAVIAEFIPPAAAKVYASNGSFLEMAEAGRHPHLIASANWHATAQFLARRLGDGLLVDIGSTTTDIVPFQNGMVMASGDDDARRLASGELVYTGVVRTPLAAIAQDAPFDGRRVGVMAELFATAGDMHRLTGRLPEGADLHATADGRGKSLAESRARLARMIGMDASAADEIAWRLLAEAFARAQLRHIEAAAEIVLSRHRLPAEAPIAGAGCGRFLAEELARRLGRPYLGFDTVVEADPVAAGAAADAAPAVAVALLLGQKG